jgi:hypothetical protein
VEDDDLKDLYAGLALIGLLMREDNDSDLNLANKAFNLAQTMMYVKGQRDEC